MPSRHFAKLKTLSVEASNQWPSVRPSSRRVQSESERYLAAADQLLVDVQKQAPIIGQEVVREPGPLGVRVLFRTCYIAAQLGRQENMPVKELSTVLRHPDSFAPLEPLLTHDSTVSGFTEEELGLIPYESAIEPSAQVLWKFSNGALAVPGLESMIAKRQAIFGNPDAKGCPAHHARIVRPLFESAVTICERDENLFALSLARS